MKAFQNDTYRRHWSTRRKDTTVIIIVSCSSKVKVKVKNSKVNAGFSNQDARLK